MKLHNSDKSCASEARKPVTRRRCLSLMAACVSVPIWTNPAGAARILEQLKKITWEGRALGADAGITLYTDDERHARETLSLMLAEIKKLEHQFSLFQEDALINELNRRGVLINPPTEFHALLTKALNIAARSGGRFDPTVQPLFMALKACARDRTAPNPAFPWISDIRVKQARKLINWRDVICAPDKVAFRKPGMAITLNGIAQGFITDRATDILKNAGFNQTLVNFGEYNALEPTSGREGWRIRLGAATKNGPERPVWTLKNSALAASARSGYVFDERQDLHHMLDPLSGTSAALWREIYVEAPNATLADGASTALFATPEIEVKTLFHELGLTHAYLIADDGRTIELKAASFPGSCNRS